MIGWRIARAKHGAGIDGTGGLYTNGRWHTRGTRVCYASANVALAMLEIRVHVQSAADLPDDYRLYRFTFPAAAPVLRVEEAELPTRWRNDLPATRAIGDLAHRERTALILDVPSVLVPFDRNLVVVASHSEVASVEIADMQTINFDDRLFVA